MFILPIFVYLQLNRNASSRQPYVNWLNIWEVKQSQHTLTTMVLKTKVCCVACLPACLLVLFFKTIQTFCHDRINTHNYDYSFVVNFQVQPKTKNKHTKIHATNLYSMSTGWMAIRTRKQWRWCLLFKCDCFFIMRSILIMSS